MNENQLLVSDKRKDKINLKWYWNVRQRESEDRATKENDEHRWITWRINRKRDEVNTAKENKEICSTYSFKVTNIKQKHGVWDKWYWIFEQKKMRKNKQTNQWMPHNEKFGVL